MEDFGVGEPPSEATEPGEEEEEAEDEVGLVFRGGLADLRMESTGCGGDAQLGTCYFEPEGLHTTRETSVIGVEAQAQDMRVHPIGCTGGQHEALTTPERAHLLRMRETAARECVRVLIAHQPDDRHEVEPRRVVRAAWAVFS